MYLSDVNSYLQKYSAGRYNINLFSCCHYEIDSVSQADLLDREKEKIEVELADWSRFQVCTDIVDHDIMMYYFYTEYQPEKETFQQFVSLAIN